MSAVKHLLKAKTHYEILASKWKEFRLNLMFGMDQCATK